MLFTYGGRPGKGMASQRAVSPKTFFELKTDDFFSLRARAVRVPSAFLSHAARQAENKIGPPKSIFIPRPLSPSRGFPAV